MRWYGERNLSIMAKNRQGEKETRANATKAAQEKIQARQDFSGRAWL